MIITTRKPTMASLAIILCALIGCAYCVLEDACVTNAKNHFTCDLVNNTGTPQFTVKKGAQARTMDIILPNLKRDSLAHATLNLTIEGVTVDETKEVIDDNVWNLKFSDEAEGDRVGTITIAATEGVTVNKFFWPATADPPTKREVCIHLGTDQSWYSTYQQKTQHWPMDLTAEIASFPLNSIPLDSTDSEIEFIVEHLFLSSKGFAILLDRDAPLWLRIVANATDPLMCVTARKVAPYDTKSKDQKYTDIKFDIFTGANIHDVYNAVSNKLPNILKPKEIPQDYMFANPIWSISAGKGFFSSDVDIAQGKVALFTDELKNHAYHKNMLLLETDWDSSFLTFNQPKFNSPSIMMGQIHKTDYRLNLFVHPYVKSDSPDYINNKELFVKDKSGSEGLLIRNGKYKDCYIVDFSNKDGVAWFKKQLDKLKTYAEVDSFVFDSISFSDNSFSLAASFAQTPVKFVQEYLKLADSYGGLTVVRDGYRSQELSVFTQMMDRTTEWSYQKGLKSLIPTVLAMSIGGYSFIMPDVIGGRTGKPSKELYIRWAQACTFLPTMQFSIPPWAPFYDDDTEDSVKKLVALHNKNRALFVNLAHKRMKDGTPIILPMWFVAPEEESAFKIDDQFMVGTDLLVAPVLNEKKTERDVFFPLGKWQDGNDKSNSYDGPITKTISAPLDVLPYFIRLKA